MHGANGWLMGLSFLLGLLLTFAFAVGRVKREVPVSARAGADGRGPAGWTIKGNEASMLYHTTESPWYEQTVAEVWFVDEKTAAAAGFSRWDTAK